MKFVEDKFVVVVLTAMLIVSIGGLVLINKQISKQHPPVIEQQQPITCVVELYNKPREVHEYHGVQK